jgi:hypothetical protein|tara:strand:- start:399 stop:671 length:273 start_codon:yes stop_codon:yes gene_type:complete
MNKPKLTDIKTITFFNDINKNIHLDNLIEVKPKPKFTGKFDYLLIHLLILSVFILFIYLLYKRYKSKEINKLIYNHKINKLYNNINNHNG